MLKIIWGAVCVSVFLFSIAAAAYFGSGAVDCYPDCTAGQERLGDVVVAAVGLVVVVLVIAVVATLRWWAVRRRGRHEL